MFTGIVEEAGRVLQMKEHSAAWRLTVAAAKIQENLAVGDSLAVNGCCLTVVDSDSTTVTCELLKETLRLTSFQELTALEILDQAAGATSDILDFRSAESRLTVNLERSLQFNGRVGGHFMTGHIDGRGRVNRFERMGKDHYMRIAPEGDFMRYLVYKGCIGIDGVSLTVAEVGDTDFAVWLIPHTLEVTNLSEIKPGDPVNLEFDLLGKYVKRFLEGRADEKAESAKGRGGLEGKESVILA
jgi:riboflavin synthase